MSEKALRHIRENIEKHKRGEDARKLNLTNCEMTQLPDEIRQCVWVVELTINNNKNLKDMVGLADLKNLQLLACVNTQVSDLSSLAELGELNYLNCNETQVSDLIPLAGLINLHHLDCDNTQVSDLIPLAGLINLEHLGCRSTQISDLSTIYKLKWLRELYVGGTRIKDISPIAALSNLLEFSCWQTAIIDLSPLSNLKRLQKFWCWGTQVSDLRPLADLKHLQYLNCSSTPVSNLEPLADLKHLQYLNCSGTHVSDLNALSNLDLHHLNCQNTKLSDLRPLKKIIESGYKVQWGFGGNINVRDCPLTNPPREIVEQGNKAILRYWEQIEKQGAETLNEAKLIIVGEGKTGKTTLFNKLINPAFDLEKNPTDETHGINVHEGLEIEEGFRANLWDFGGQDLQYMTHQFFLTPRALYLLVMEARAEAPNLPYWFRIISLLGKYTAEEKVSLLLVLNKRKGSTGRPQYEDLLKIYVDDFDLEFFEVDFAVNDKRWESLREAIVRRLRALPIVKNKLPKQWQPIREALRGESETRPHISTEQLHEICAKFNVPEEEDQLQMTDYLHQLGSLLHFQNDPDLLTTVVLQAKWAVDGVYTTLKSELIKTQNGKFLPDDIFHILRSNGYKKADAQRILKLMSKNNFDICYPSKGGKHYVAAQLLPTDRPAQYTWHTRAGALQFRYRYAIMPKGLMSRLIVRLSEYIERLEETEIVWRKGAILRIPVNNSVCRVMMVEDEDSKSGLKQIVVEVMEDNDLRPNRKYALQLVRDEVESLHRRWFRNIQFEQIIPCNCRQCRIRETPFTFELSELQRLTKGMAFCNILEDFVPVIQLLEGVYKEDEIRAFAFGARPGHRSEQEMELPRIPDININIENKPRIAVTNQNTNINKTDITALEEMLDQLPADKKAALKNYVEMLPEPDSPEEKNSLGKSILKWLDKNAEGIAVNVSASVYYDALRMLFGF